MANNIKNILYVSPFSGNHTGSPRALLDLAGNLDKNLYSPTLLVPEDGPLVQDFKGIGGEVFYKKSIGLNRRNFFSYLKSIKEFRSFYKEQKVDLVHFNSPGWRESAAVAARLGKIPVILHVHNPCPENGMKRNFNFNLASKVIIVSESMREDFKKYPNILNKTTCIYNGVDLKSFSLNSNSDVFRNQISVKSGIPVVGYVGQLSHRKGVDLLVKAAPAVLRRFPGAMFLITGADGIYEDGYTDSMKAIANELEVIDHFLFIGKRNDVPEVMNACDLIVVPSRAEPFGKVVIEAMACGKCVIASAVGGIPEIIENGKNGLLVQPDNVEALETAILKALENNDINRSLAQNGKKTAVERFSIEVLVEKTQRLYSSLLAK